MTNETLATIGTAFGNISAAIAEAAASDLAPSDVFLACYDFEIARLLRDGEACGEGVSGCLQVARSPFQRLMLMGH